jgi:hypothetical protein
MFKGYGKWYRGLTPVKRLGLSFLLNWMYWLFAWKLGEQIFFDEIRSWRYHLIHATWMSVFWTLLFQWEMIKGIIKQRKDKKQT